MSARGTSTPAPMSARSATSSRKSRPSASGSRHPSRLLPVWLRRTDSRHGRARGRVAGRERLLALFVDQRVEAPRLVVLVLRLALPAVAALARALVRLRLVHAPARALGQVSAAGERALHVG